MPTITRRGALSVTSDIDRIANVIQHEHAALGIPKEYALKYAYYSDVMSDRIEKHAAKMSEEVKEELEEVKEEAAPEKKEASRKRGFGAKKADDETGLSVDHGTSGFDANVIADDVGGPQEILAPVEAWMNDYFTQGWFQELGDLQQSGGMGKAAAKAQVAKAAASLQKFISKKAEEAPKAEEPKKEDEVKKEASRRQAEDERLLRKMLAEEEAKAEEPKVEEVKKEARSRRQAEEAPAKEEEKVEEPKKASTHGYDLFAN